MSYATGANINPKRMHEQTRVTYTRNHVHCVLAFLIHTFGTAALGTRRNGRGNHRQQQLFHNHVHATRVTQYTLSTFANKDSETECACEECHREAMPELFKHRM